MIEPEEAVKYLVNYLSNNPIHDDIPKSGCFMKILYATKYGASNLQEILEGSCFESEYEHFKKDVVRLSLMLYIVDCWNKCKVNFLTENTDVEYFYDTLDLKKELRELTCTQKLTDEYISCGKVILRDGYRHVTPAIALSSVKNFDDVVPVIDVEQYY